MGIGNRLFNILLFIFLFNTFIKSQEINCYKSVCFNRKNDLVEAVNDYILADQSKNVIINIDFIKKDSLSLFRIVGRMQPFQLFFKKPDCYFFVNNNICYLYTEKYKQNKDTKWLDLVLNRTFEFLDLNPEIEHLIKVNWEKDSILEISNFSYPIDEYSPIVIEYLVYNGKIINKESKNSMLYPDLSAPKGIKYFRAE